MQELRRITARAGPVLKASANDTVTRKSFKSTGRPRYTNF